MFSLFPAHRPRIGVSVRAHALDLVEIRRRWRKPPLLRRVAARPLPPGLLTPSCAAPNIVDQETFTKELRALLEGVRDRAVAVDLPLASATLGLFGFDTFPPSTTEQDSLLRWRFRQEEHVAANDLHLVSRVFGVGGPHVEGTAVSVLAVAVRQSVLQQYHQAFDTAGLLPVSVGFSTLNLFDFYREVMPQSRECFFAHRTGETLIVLAIHDGRPVFLRTKPVRRSHVDLKAELVKTLQFFDSQFPHETSSGATTSSPFYVVDELAGLHQTPEPMELPSSEVWTPTSNPHWTVAVTRVDWSIVPVATSLPIPAHPPFGALAGVLAS